MSPTVGPDIFVTRSPRPIAAVPEHSEPSISFVLVTYGTGAVVIEAIASLVESLTDGAPTFEVIVVDNQHPDRSHRSATQLMLDTAGVRVVRPHQNLGFGGGNNLGVAHARGTTIGLVNPDVQFSPGWLAPLLNAVDDGAAIAAPVLVEVDGTVQSAGHRLAADGSTHPITSLPGSGADDVPDYASAACWVMHRSVFDQLGGFDESFFPAYYEDVDLALRARAVGGTVVVGESTVIHHRGASTAEGKIADTTPQRKRLLAKWPKLGATQHQPPGCDQI